VYLKEKESKESAFGVIEDEIRVKYFGKIPYLCKNVIECFE
jgi:hypothetical protein